MAKENLDYPREAISSGEYIQGSGSKGLKPLDRASSGLSPVTGCSHDWQWEAFTQNQGSSLEMRGSENLIRIRIEYVMLLNFL